MVLKGVVREVSDVRYPEGQGKLGSHLTMETNHSLVLVHLAPAKIMKDRQLTFAPGDLIEVVGMRVHYFDRNDMIAHDITRGDQSFFLRDRRGHLIVNQ